MPLDFSCSRVVANSALFSPDFVYQPADFSFNFYFMANRKRKRGRPATGGPEPFVGLRLPAKLLAHVDKAARRETVDRSKIIRRFIVQGLVLHEALARPGRSETDAQRLDHGVRPLTAAATSFLLSASPRTFSNLGAEMLMSAADRAKARTLCSASSAWRVGFMSDALAGVSGQKLGGPFAAVHERISEHAVLSGWLRPGGSWTLHSAAGITHAEHRGDLLEPGRAAQPPRAYPDRALPALPFL